LKIIYAQESVEIEGKSIFLAGPTPRSKYVESWRNDAISAFQLLRFNGTLFVPEMRDGNWDKGFAYSAQIEWEEECLSKADVILFWIPRNDNTLPGFTTNIEFGYWVAKDPNKLVLGAPTTAIKMDYLKYYAKKLKIPFSSDLAHTITLAIGKTKEQND
jgi:hypothetical protein